MTQPTEPSDFFKRLVSSLINSSKRENLSLLDTLVVTEIEESAPEGIPKNKELMIRAAQTLVKIFYEFFSGGNLTYDQFINFMYTYKQGCFVVNLETDLVYLILYFADRVSETHSEFAKVTRNNLFQEMNNLVLEFASDGSNLFSEYLQDPDRISHTIKYLTGQELDFVKSKQVTKLPSNTKKTKSTKRAPRKRVKTIELSYLEELVLRSYSNLYSELIKYPDYQQVREEVFKLDNKTPLPPTLYQATRSSLCKKGLVDDTGLLTLKGFDVFLGANNV